LRSAVRSAAAEALGLPPARVMRLVVLPQGRGELRSRHCPCKVSIVRHNYLFEIRLSEMFGCLRCPDRLVLVLVGAENDHHVHVRAVATVVGLYLDVSPEDLGNASGAW